MTTLFSPVDCPHRNFDLRLYPGIGHEGYCPDCGVRGEQSPIARRAMENFEKKIRGLQSEDRRRKKKQKSLSA